jgi:hypothetical protein
MILALLLKSKRFRHPALEDVEDIGPARELIGWICGLIFILSFTVVPVSQ